MHRRFIFIDESGDFGFSDKSSHHITLSAIVVSDKVALERVPRRVRRYLGKSAKNGSELKFHRSEDSVKRKILSAFSSLPDAKIVCIIVDKRKVSGHYRNRRNDMYDDMCRVLIESFLWASVRSRRIDIFFDIRPRNKPKNRDFDSMITKEIEKQSEMMKIIAPTVFMSRVSSETCPGLIVADFIAGAIQRKHEHGSFEYYALISNSILVEKRWG